jgi:glutamate N-acetyltransferase/amino-acid N-acetyltransferase
MKSAIGGVTIFRNGGPVKHDARKVAKLMAKGDIEVTVDLGVGKASAAILTCDLSHDYVTINAEYHT